MDLVLNTFQLFNENIIWFTFMIIYAMGVWSKQSWTSSIRSMITLLVMLLFVQLSMSKMDPKDSLLIISLVTNFYFLKQAMAGTNGTTPTV